MWNYPIEIDILKYFEENNLWQSHEHMLSDADSDWRRDAFKDPFMSWFINWKIKGAIYYCWFNARGGGIEATVFILQGLHRSSIPLFWPIFSESGIVFSVRDLVWPWSNGSNFLTSIYQPQKLKNSKSLEYRHVAYQIKAEDIIITKKICLNKLEVKWLTFNDLWWPQNLASWNICMMYIKRKMSTQGYNMWQPFFSVLDYLTSHDHDLTSYDLFWPFDLKNS